VLRQAAGMVPIVRAHAAGHAPPLARHRAGI
jgi:hypothetical protein